jgi:hypothetical protein
VSRTGGGWSPHQKGEKITADEADRRGGKYLFEINSKWTIDGTTRKNTARYVNHACIPIANCEAEVKNGRIWILAKKNIEAGQELFYDYGKEYFDEHIKPHGCRCAKRGIESVGVVLLSNSTRLTPRRNRRWRRFALLQRDVRVGMSYLTVPKHSPLMEFYLDTRWHYGTVRPLSGKLI